MPLFVASGAHTWGAWSTVPSAALQMGSVLGESSSHKFARRALIGLFHPNHPCAHAIIVYRQRLNSQDVAAKAHCVSLGKGRVEFDLGRPAILQAGGSV